MRSRATIALCLGLVVLCVANAGAADPAKPGDAVLGKWWFPKKNGKMEVTRRGDLYIGKVIAYDVAGQLDNKNPDESLRSRPFVGVEMLKDFKYDAAGKQWTGGTIYDGDSGKTYNSSMWFENNDTSKLNARGYVGISLFGRTEIFTRLTPAEEKQLQADETKKEEEKTAEKTAEPKK